MLDKLKSLASHPRIKQLSDVRNIGLYLFGLIVLAITWSGINTIQDNYQLQKKIATLKQQNEVQRLENDTLKLKNKYLETDQYLELAARRQFGKAEPGETVFVIPKAVALKHVQQTPGTQSQNNKATTEESDEPSWQQNWNDWWDFFRSEHNSAD